MSGLKTESELRPSDNPPAATGDGGAASDAPRALEELQQDLIGGVTAQGLAAAPTLEPPATVLEAAAVGLWQTNKTVNALFATSAPRNSWMHIVNPNVWRRLSPLSDSGVAAMSMLAAHARDRGRPVNYREEADGMVHELYVW